jgi:predicted nuclease of restriction endonuclease-like RecB superfamily
VLTADLVHARRRGEELHLVGLNADARARAVALADRLLLVMNGAVGVAQDEVTAVLGAVDSEARDARVKAGLVKLLLDRCEWAAPSSLPPEDLRRDLFTLASEMRAALGPFASLDRGAVVRSIAERYGATEAAVEEGLFADKKTAQRLVRWDPLTSVELVESFERGQAQAVLLRAVKIKVEIQRAAPGPTRAFFRRLKFLRLLHAIFETKEGYEVEIDGPFSLFESVTKYGLGLALVLPALDGLDAWKLSADIRWGKARQPLLFRLEGGAARPGENPPLADDVASLLRSFEALGTEWRVSTRTKLLHLPGLGLIVPDLVFERSDTDGRPQKVHLEVMGYWSRDAVWKRVELVRAGLPERVLFALSSRLRVSEAVLGEDLPSALYVYKGAMSARAVRDRLELIAARGVPTSLAPP